MSKREREIIARTDGMRVHLGTVTKLGCTVIAGTDIGHIGLVWYEHLRTVVSEREACTKKLQEVGEKKGQSKDIFYGKQKGPSDFSLPSL